MALSMPFLSDKAAPVHRRTHVLLRPAVALPFAAVALIWGSTWFVIKDGLEAAPPSWSVAYRFAIASAAMFLLAARSGRGSGRGIGLSREGHAMAAILGLVQFCLNLNFVYHGEVHLTSGIVAVMFSLIMLPNAVLGKIFLGTPVTARFMAGTMVALGGIVLLLVNEGLSMPAGTDLALGITLCTIGILAASVANVMQASKTAQRSPLLSLLAWAMLWGFGLDAAYAFASAGPPVWPQDASYWGGVVYLALVGSVVTFPLYFKLIRDLGPGRAAYNGVLVPIVAMVLSTLFEGYRWNILAASGVALALVGMVIALRGRQLD